MSSTALSLSSSLRPLSSASRPKTTNPRKPSHKIPKPNPNPNHNPNPNLKFRIGGQATTYTRLPPKDDPSLGSEIKLIESISPQFDFTPKPPFPVKNSVDSSFYEEIIMQEDEESDFDDEIIEVPELGFDIDVDGDDEDEEEFKEKGVPAVMRCFDRAKIYVKAGDGGNGVVAFRREKFVPFGGPSGGDGGKGGNVYVEVDGSMNSLLPFRKNVHFRAERGSHGQGRKQAGARGEDVVVKVAPGTVVREAKKGEVEGEVLLELVRPGERALILPGGRGGRGNASFKSGTNKVPKIAENGEEGAEL